MVFVNHDSLVVIYTSRVRYRSMILLKQEIGRNLFVWVLSCILHRKQYGFWVDVIPPKIIKYEMIVTQPGLRRHAWICPLIAYMSGIFLKRDVAGSLNIGNIRMLIFYEK